MFSNFAVAWPHTIFVADMQSPLHTYDFHDKNNYPYKANLQGPKSVANLLTRFKTRGCFETLDRIFDINGVVDIITDERKTDKGPPKPRTIGDRIKWIYRFFEEVGPAVCGMTPEQHAAVVAMYKDRQRDPTGIDTIANAERLLDSAETIPQYEAWTREIREYYNHEKREYMRNTEDNRTELEERRFAGAINLINVVFAPMVCSNFASPRSNLEP
ncbi:hypothetical protein HDU89_001544 [Geranomyces variabilis]|nr:hypothetical protein HDU89_001544 [Geranomyces variabilis]